MESDESTGLFYVVVLTPFLLGVLHHVDHIVRGNHVGWPLTAEVTPFTLSLGVYPLALLGLYLMYFTDRDVTGYWLGSLDLAPSWLPLPIRLLSLREI